MAMHSKRIEEERRLRSTVYRARLEQLWVTTVL